MPPSTCPLQKVGPKWGQNGAKMGKKSGIYCDDICMNPNGWSLQMELLAVDPVLRSAVLPLLDCSVVRSITWAGTLPSGKPAKRLHLFSKVIWCVLGETCWAAASICADWRVCSFVFCWRDLVVNDSVQVPAGMHVWSGSCGTRREVRDPAEASAFVSGHLLHASEMKQTFLSELEVRPHAASDDKHTERNQNREKQGLQFQSWCLLPLLAGFQSSWRWWESSSLGLRGLLSVDGLLAGWNNRV